jgi:AcrR family transcriptional regulator
MVQPGENHVSKKAQMIVATAETLFQKHGFKRVTIEEICATASVSKMTFYKYFPNKDELFKYIINKWYDESQRLMHELNMMDIPFAEKIRRIMRLKEEFIFKQGEELMADYMNPGPQFNAFFKEFYAKGIQLFIEFIRSAQEKGEVRKEIRPEFLIVMLNKLIEAGKDPELIALYPGMKEFSLEFNNFLYYGILPHADLEQQHE